MTANIQNYLDGMISWNVLKIDEQEWIVINHPNSAPRGAWLDMMGR